MTGPIASIPTCPSCGKTQEFCSACGHRIATARPRNGRSRPDSNAVTAAATTSDPSLQTEFELVADRYEIGPPLGTGAMATVFRAYDRRLERPVAIKLLSPRAVRQAARFRREAVLAARLRHPNIVPIYDVGAERRRQFIVMECVEGSTLRDIVRRRGPIPCSDARRYVAQVARGIGFAHDSGVIHRDLKPQNVMLERFQDRIMVVDFGLACGVSELGMMTGTGVVGTPMFMSPEQARGENLDSRSDLFSVGLIYYYLVVGRPLFEATSLRQLRLQHEQARVDEALDALTLPERDRERLAAVLRIERSERIPDVQFLV